MHLAKLHTQGTRGIVDAVLSLGDAEHPPAKWVVLAGPNASGKTTLLQSIVAGVVGTRHFRNLVPEEHWLNRSAEHARSTVWLIPDQDDLPVSTKMFQVAVGFGRDETEETDSFPDQGLGLRGIQFNGIQPVGWMLAGYGANRFDATSTSVAEELGRGPVRRASVVTLFRRDASLYATNAWAREVFAAFLEASPTARSIGLSRPAKSGVPTTDLSFWQNRLVCLQGALERCFSLWFDGRVSVGISTQGIMLNLDHSGSVPLASVGQGLESLGLLVADIVRQAAAFHGSEFMGGRDAILPGRQDFALPHSGIVLIDEIENHLHPQLEKRLRDVLTAVFPEIQFIVTTHSPFIAQTAVEGGLFKVRPGGEVVQVTGDEFRQVTTGTIDDVILTSLFGLTEAYSEDTRGRRDELVRLQARVLLGTATPDDEGRIRALRSELTVGPSLDRSALELAELLAGDGDEP